MQDDHLILSFLEQDDLVMLFDGLDGQEKLRSFGIMRSPFRHLFRHVYQKGDIKTLRLHLVISVRFLWSACF